MDQVENNPLLQLPTPDPALKRLDALVGKWRLVGRTLDAAEDNIDGWTTFTWLPGGFFLEQRIEMNFMGILIQSLELIGYDPNTGKFPSHVYSNVWGQPVPYLWEMEGENLTITMPGMAKYTGVLSKDGTRMAGGWRPDPGKEGPENIPYDISGGRVE